MNVQSTDPETNAPIAGWCAPGFASVRDAFAANFAERGEVGAGVCVVVGGQVVVDLIGGWRDEARTQLWTEDTLVNFYSVGKAIVATLLLQLVDQGLVGLDDPIASVWPEFAAQGKQGATIRHALSHRAGVPAIREPLTNADLSDWSRMADALAATEPWWEPGSRHTYHTNTYGHLLGEIVRRVTGDMPHERLRRITDSLNADVWFGVPAEHHHRCGEVIWAPGPSSPSSSAFSGIHSLSGDSLMIALGYANPPGYSSMGVVNSPSWRSAQIPSTNGHGTAKGIARIYSALLEPSRLISPELLSEATHVQSEGFCPVLGEQASFGLGFTPTTERRRIGPNPHSFGHFGTGGALGFADPTAGVAFGYVMNHVIPRWQSTRNRSLVEAVYASL